MDATRPRRSRDYPRQRWYARWRSLRFARHLGFQTPAAEREDRDPKAPEAARAGITEARGWR
jgi:hypothetical protein